MLSKADKIAFTVLSIIAVLVIASLPFKSQIKALWFDKAVVLSSKEETGNNNSSSDRKTNQVSGSPIQVAQRWEMPAVLKEISGVAYIDDNRMACVQDEQGKIYIYNPKKKEVEKEIPFAPTGDYEGIAIAGNTAFVLRADGRLFEILNYNTKPSVVEHATPLTEKQDVEGLAYDKKNNRLLLAIKGYEPNTKDYKGIYAFDLKTQKMAADPVYKVDLMHTIWKDSKGKQKMEPSDLDIHPLTGDIYITDGAKPKLLIMDTAGNMKSLFPLDESKFPQPEGVAFTPEGELIISSEGKNGSGSISKVLITGS